MDTELLKTFIEVARTRHFGRAAGNLYVTQSAVSARIRLLEQEIGRPLFSRTRNNIQLTSYGEKFITHAEDVLRAWENACSSLAIEEEPRQSLAIGGITSLWEICLSPWLHHLYQAMPGFDLTVAADTSDTLTRKLSERLLDICFTLDPHPIPDLVSRKVSEIPLIMVSLPPQIDMDQALALEHIMVDWGKMIMPAYQDHAVNLPRPTLRINSARLALDFFLDCGGTVFLPRTLLHELLQNGQVVPVQGAPQFLCPIYAHYYSSSDNREAVNRALEFSHLIT